VCGYDTLFFWCGGGGVRRREGREGGREAVNVCVCEAGTAKKK